MMTMRDMVERVCENLEDWGQKGLGLWRRIPWLRNQNEHIQVRIAVQSNNLKM